MAGPQRLRVLFWNTFLLPGLRLPRGRELFGSRLRSVRAAAIGAELAGRYDVAVLAEVWTARDRATLVRSWRANHGAPSVTGGPEGPGQLLRRGSGLATVVDGPTVTRSLAVPFAEREPRWHGIDAWQRKGVLCCAVNVPGTDQVVELISTHMSIGGWFDAGPEHERGRAARRSEISQLVSVIGDFHQPGASVVVLGDFNVIAGTDEYDELCTAMAGVGLVDWWPEIGVGSGATFGLLQDDRCGAVAPEDPDFCVDPGVDTPGSLRIDLVFGEAPSRGAVRPSVMRRRPFAWPDDPGGGGGASPQNYLSDHLALHLELGT